MRLEQNAIKDETKKVVKFKSIEELHKKRDSIGGTTVFFPKQRRSRRSIDLSNLEPRSSFIAGEFHKRGSQTGIPDEKMTQRGVPRFDSRRASQISFENKYHNVSLRPLHGDVKEQLRKSFIRKEEAEEEEEENKENLQSDGLLSPISPMSPMSPLLPMSPVSPMSPSSPTSTLREIKTRPGNSSIASHRLSSYSSVMSPDANEDEDFNIVVKRQSYTRERAKERLERNSMISRSEKRLSSFSLINVVASPDLSVAEGPGFDGSNSNVSNSNTSSASTTANGTKFGREVAKKEYLKEKSRKNKSEESDPVKYERITRSLIHMFDHIQTSNQNKAQIIEKLEGIKTQNKLNKKKLDGLLSRINEVELSFEKYDSKVDNDCTLIMICMCLIKSIGEE